METIEGAVNRRTLVTGFASLLAAPAIVRAESLMPISGDIYRVWEWRSPILPDPLRWNDGASYMSQFRGPNGRLYEGIWTFFGKDHNIYSDKQIAFRKVEYPA